MRLFECYKIKPEFTTIPVVNPKDVYIPNLITAELEEVDDAIRTVVEEELEKAVRQTLKTTMSCYTNENVEFYITRVMFDYMEVYLHKCGVGCKHD